MKDSFKNIKNHTHYRIIELATKKIGKLEKARFKLNSLNLSINFKSLFFTQKLPDIQLNEIKSFNPGLGFERYPKKNKISLSELTKSGELFNEFSMCKKKISYNLKSIKSNIIVLKSNSYLNSLIFKCYNYILEYLIFHKFLSDKNPESNVLESSYTAMPIDPLFLSKQLDQYQSEVDEIEDELIFYELLLQYFNESSLLEIKVDLGLQTILTYDLGEIEFYRYIIKEITELKQSLSPEFYNEIDNIVKEFNKINNSILDLRDYTREHCIRKLWG